MTLTQITEKGIKDGEIVNADINASAAIAKSKLASLNIVNADVNSSAAIAKEKLEDFVTGNSNNRLLTATGNTNSLTGESSFTYNGNGGLDMEGTGAAFFQIKTPDSTDGGVYFRTGTTNAGAISYLHNSTLADGVMNFRSGGTTKMVIKGNGRVGINNTSPAGKFHVSDTYHFLATGGNATTGMKIGNYDGTNYGVLTTRGSQLRFDIGDANKMILDSSGNLQFRNASTSPQALEWYYNNTKNVSFFFGDNYANPTLNIYRADAQTGFPYGNLIINTGDSTNPTQALKLRTDKNIELAGNLIMASGKGIDFSATANSSGTMSSELLDDYEEGQWTPVYNSGVTDAGSYSNTLGHYTKIGNLVTFTARVQMSGSNAAYSHLIIQGLPYTSSGSKKEGGASIGYGQAINQNNTSGKPTAHIPMNHTSISFYEPSGGALYANNSTFVNLDETLHIRGFYYV